MDDDEYRRFARAKLRADLLRIAVTLALVLAAIVFVAAVNAWSAP